MPAGVLGQQTSAREAAFGIPPPGDFQIPNAANAQGHAPGFCCSWQHTVVSYATSPNGQIVPPNSANTIRAYRTDLTAFEGWCRKKGHTMIPAKPETVADFVLSQSENVEPATIMRRRAAIAKIHAILRLENPIGTEDVRLATRRIRRQKPRRPKQALGLTGALKIALIGACPGNSIGLRDRTLFAMGYDTLCRRAELAQLQIEDISFSPDGSRTVLVRKSKTDQTGEGRLAYLSKDTIVHLQRWLKATGLKTGPIFRAVTHGKVLPHALCGFSVARILKSRAELARLDPEIVAKLSGHSMRVGAAQDMAAAGIDLGAIMHAGGWKSSAMVIRYIEHMDVQKSGMARLYSAGITR
jgi:integrase